MPKFVSPRKKGEDRGGARLGATVVLADGKDALKKLKGSLDFILSTIPQKTDLNPFVVLLKHNASLIIVGALEPLEPFNNMQITGHRNSVGGLLIGPIAETQAVLDFCASTTSVRIFR